MKKVVVLSDGHCGHYAGLTPPAWQQRKGNNAKLQKEMWNEYIALKKHIGKVDVVIGNGDFVEGKGSKSGGTELITSDLTEQVDMAFDAVKIWNPKHIFFTYGTPYHTSPNGEDLEVLLARRFNADIRAQINIKIENVVFNFKHDVHASSIPWTRAAAVGRERIHAMLWSEHDNLPTPDVIVRGHTHYYSYQGGIAKRPWVAMTLPALQAAGTKYGGRRCSGTVDWGITVFDVDDKQFAWNAYIIRLKNEARKLIRIK